MADPKIPQAVPEPRFTNVARIRHTPAEFYIEFAQLSLDQPGVASLVSALVMTPQHAKSLLKALAENIAKYERQQGEIALPNPSQEEPMQ
jgi:hypothetical protein